MNVNFLRSELQSTREIIESKLKGIPISVSCRVYFENARREECDFSDKGVKYVNGDIIFLKNGAKDTDSYLFGLCLATDADGRISYPSSRRNAPDAEAEFREMLDNAIEYAEKLADSDDPITEMAYDLERSRKMIKEYEAAVAKTKKRSLILLGAGAVIALGIIILSILL